MQRNNIFSAYEIFDELENLENIIDLYFDAGTYLGKEKEVWAAISCKEAIEKRLEEYNSSALKKATPMVYLFLIYWLTDFLNDKGSIYKIVSDSIEHIESHIKKTYSKAYSIFQEIMNQLYCVKCNEKNNPKTLEITLAKLDSNLNHILNFILLDNIVAVAEAQFDILEEFQKDLAVLATNQSAIVGAPITITSSHLIHSTTQQDAITTATTSAHTTILATQKNKEVLLTNTMEPEAIITTTTKTVLIGLGLFQKNEQSKNINYSDPNFNKFITLFEAEKKIIFIHYMPDFIQNHLLQQIQNLNSSLAMQQDNLHLFSDDRKNIILNNLFHYFTCREQEEADHGIRLQLMLSKPSQISERKKHDLKNLIKLDRQCDQPDAEIRFVCHCLCWIFALSPPLTYADFRAMSNLNNFRELSEIFYLIFENSIKKLSSILLNERNHVDLTQDADNQIFSTYYSAFSKEYDATFNPKVLPILKNEFLSISSEKHAKYCDNKFNFLKAKEILNVPFIKTVETTTPSLKR